MHLSDFCQSDIKERTRIAQTKGKWAKWGRDGLEPLVAVARLGGLGAVVEGVGAGAQRGASRGLHGKWRQNQYPPPHHEDTGFGDSVEKSLKQREGSIG